MRDNAAYRSRCNGTRNRFTYPINGAAGTSARRFDEKHAAYLYFTSVRFRAASATSRETRDSRIREAGIRRSPRIRRGVPCRVSRGIASARCSVSPRRDRWRNNASEASLERRNLRNFSFLIRLRSANVTRIKSGAASGNYSPRRRRISAESNVSNVNVNVASARRGFFISRFEDRTIDRTRIRIRIANPKAYRGTFGHRVSE